MMMSDLPNDLIEEILSRIPATSLKQLRFTCTLWNSLFIDTKFTNKHFGKAPRDFSFLMLKNYMLSIKINLQEVNNKLFVDPATKVSYDTNSHTYLGKTHISKVFHCNGLLLCTTKDNRLVVWNPCTSQTRWIKLNNRHDINICFALGYEKDKYFHSFKILRYFDNRNLVFDITKSNDRVAVPGIYEFSSDSWRAIDGITFEFFLRGDGVSVMGNIYWPLYTEVLVFDFKLEKFRCLNLPDQKNHHGFLKLSSLNDDKLIISYRFDVTLQTEIWVSTIHKNDETKFLPWRKFMEIGPLYNIGYLCSIFIDEKKKFAVCGIDKLCKDKTFYIFGEDHNQIEIPLKGESRFPCWSQFPFIYVPSLLRI